MSLSVIHKPHDKFLKLSLGEPRVAQEFFTEHLPASVLQAMDLTTLKLENHSFIDPHYKSSEADIIYSVQLAQTTAYLFLLCEHQSTVDHWIAFRLWSYRIRLMELHIKQHPDQPLPLVYPLVIYTGQAPWNAPLNIFELFGNQQGLAEEWFFKPFQLLNIHQLRDEDIRRRQWCGLVEFPCLCARAHKQGKGKLERFHSTFRSQFLAEIDIGKINGLTDINARLWAWIEQVYHQRPHEGIAGKKPIDRWREDLVKIRPLGFQATQIDNIFCHRHKRLVRKDGTVSWKGQRFEVPYEQSGEHVILVLDPHINTPLRVESLFAIP